MGDGVGADTHAVCREGCLQADSHLEAGPVVIVALRRLAPHAVVTALCVTCTGTTLITDGLDRPGR